MADWNTAYNWMMNKEGAARACAQVSDACPEGVAGPCYAISGVNSGAWPAEFAAIAALPQAQREPLVQQFYQKHFWNNWYAQLASDDLCMRVFDFALNGGSGASVRCLQQAVNSLLPADATQLEEDGGWGPMTLNAANAADSTALVSAFQAKRVAYYQTVVANNRADAIYLSEWIARAEA
ncbi:MAG: putative peptidoglycan-binding domain-containing protein [Terracidiphilus sp.]|jgi:lysozyme family protein